PRRRRRRSTGRSLPPTAARREATPACGEPATVGLAGPVVRLLQGQTTPVRRPSRRLGPQPATDAHLAGHPPAGRAAARSCHPGALGAAGCPSCPPPAPGPGRGLSHLGRVPVPGRDLLPPSAGPHGGRAFQPRLGLG